MKTTTVLNNSQVERSTEVAMIIVVNILVITIGVVCGKTIFDSLNFFQIL